MGTQSLYQLDSSARLTVNSVERKLSLPLWVKLKHSQSHQQFHILLTLASEPDEETVAQLQECGLSLSPFHQSSPGRQIPGVIGKAQLEKQLLHIPSVNFVEGISVAAEDA